MRLSFLLCHEKEATSPGRGQEGPLTIIQDDQQWGQEILHALDIADLNVPDVAAGDTQDGQ